MVQGITESGTRCDKVWYKVFQGLVQGVAGSGTRCARVCTKCDRVWYKVGRPLEAYPNFA